MRKLTKVLFSQLVIVSLLLILQVALIMSFVMKLSEYFIYIDMILKIISVVVVVVILNRHSNPMYKLAWVVPILLFPLIGGLFYLFIMGQMHPKIFFSKLMRHTKKMTDCYPQDGEVIRAVSQFRPERVNTIRYINNVTGMNAYYCNDAKYFKTGEEKYKAIITELKKAKKYIFIEYFIIGEGTLWNSVLEILKEKASEGVDVRILYDGMGSMTLLKRKYPKELAKYGIKCFVFSPFTPFLSALQNNRDHRKIICIDGVTAFTGGMNLADEYINIGYKSGHFKDMGVMIKGKAAFSFVIMFLQLWFMTTLKTEDIKLFEPQDEKIDNHTAKGFVMPYYDIPYEPCQSGEFIYLDIINKAKKYVYITTPYLILDHEMVVALTNASQSGIDVRIICPYATDHWYARAVAHSYYKELILSGVKIYEYTPGFIHGKTFCSDDEIAVVGSINLDYRSLYLHFECASVFIDSPIVQSVYSDFTDTIKKCHMVTIEDENRINPFKKILYALLRIFAPLM